MLARLIEFSLTQRILTLALMALLTAFGIRAYLGLPIDAFPDVSTTQVKLILKAPGMTPEEVEARIATPIEMEMRASTSSGVMPGAFRISLTCVVETSGKASIGSPR